MNEVSAVESTGRVIFFVLMAGFVSCSASLAQPARQIDHNQQLNQNLLDEAISSRRRHADQFSQEGYIGIVDLSQSSADVRLFIVDERTRTAVASYRVSHGKGSDPDGNGVISPN